MFWLAAAGMTGLAALAVLWPLSLRRPAHGGNEGEAAFYRAQLREIERDVERGQMPMEEAASARAEAARRLIAVADETDAVPETDSRARRRVASVVILLLVPALALGVYTWVGRPNDPDAPLEARRSDPNSPDAIEFAVAKIEARLAAHPEDVRGWEVLAPVYMKLGRYNEAADAYRRLIALRGSAPSTQANYGEALLAAAQGEVTPSSREAFEAALKLDPQDQKARFYLALAAEQDGDAAKARATYEELAPKASGDEPWMIGLKARLEALRAGHAPAAGSAPAGERQASFSPEQQKMIEGMVSGLADRLSKNGGSAEEWARLIRAYTVLKQPDKAKVALGDARKAYASDATALGNFDALARELGLGG